MRNRGDIGNLANSRGMDLNIVGKYEAQTPKMFINDEIVSVFL